MKHLKKYKLFESKKQELVDNLSKEDIQDIFIELKDNNLYVENFRVGSATSMDGRKIITNPDDFDIVRGKNIDSVSVKLRTFYERNTNNGGIIVDNEFFTNFENSIGHMESQYGLKINSMYLYTSGLWFNSVDTLKRYVTIKVNDKDKMHILKNLVYIDIVFEIL